MDVVYWLLAAPKVARSSPYQTKGTVSKHKFQGKRKRSKARFTSFPLFYYHCSVKHTLCALPGRIYKYNVIIAQSFRKKSYLCRQKQLGKRQAGSSSRSCSMRNTPHGRWMSMALGLRASPMVTPFSCAMRATATARASSEVATTEAITGHARSS